VSGVDDLVQWLRDQLDTETQRATAAGGDEWRRQDHPSETIAVYDSKGDAVVYDEGWPSEAQAEHIAEHDPARVLREIEAKRRLLGLHDRQNHQCVAEDGPSQWHAKDPCATLRLLALPYADRPGFREEWRP
jgi:hypothetical protein